MSQPEPWNAVAEAYERHALPFFSEFASAALDLAGVRSGGTVVDVACGPGTLTRLAAERGARVVAVDFAEEMVARVRALALPGVEAHVMDGQALALPTCAFDAGFSLFGLMFFPERARGFGELRRVLKQGAPAVVSSWARPGFSVVADVMRELVPDVPRGIPLLERADELGAEMTAAGFDDVRVERVVRGLPWPSAAAVWAGAADSAVPLRALRARLGEGAFAALGDRVVERLVARLGAGEILIDGEANLAIGRATVAA